jgi:hypothetical protein
MRTHAQHNAVVLSFGAATAAFPSLGRSSGVPLSGLAPPCNVLFDIGRQRFLNVENVASGLGPSYNGTVPRSNQRIFRAEIKKPRHPVGQRGS